MRALAALFAQGNFDPKFASQTSFFNSLIEQALSRSSDPSFNRLATFLNTPSLEKSPMQSLPVKDVFPTSVCDDL